MDDLLANNERWASDQFTGSLPLEPSGHLAVVACMDSRMPIFGILGLEHGQAHIIRNAGGVITDDVIRSLVLSQRFLNTTEIVLMHHTDCGLAKVKEDEMRAQLEAECGQRPTWAFDAFTDPYADTRQSIRRLRSSPFLLHTDSIRGFVYDVDDGLLHEVDPDG